jgi:hypothetical protein
VTAEGRAANRRANAFAALTAAARLDRHSIPDDPPPMRLKLIDRSQVTRWFCRRPDHVGTWREISAPEERPSRQHRVIAQMMTGEWVRVRWR